MKKIILDTVEIYPEKKIALFFYKDIKTGYMAYKAKTNVTPASITRLLQATKRGFYTFTLGDHIWSRPVISPKYYDHKFSCLR
jgi:hypothetical protein